MSAHASSASETPAPVPRGRFSRRSPVPRSTPFLFLAPYAALTLVFLAYPLYRAVELAFYQTAGPRAKIWVGLDNFRFMFSDPDFWKALSNTTIFAVVGTAVMIPVSLGLALLLNSQQGKRKGFFRLVFFSPYVVSPIFVGIIFSIVFSPRYGIFNKLLFALVGWGLETRWLETPSLVMPAIVLTNMWLYTGFNMIYFLAALQNVDQTLVDAARIDGAGRWDVFRHVTMPAIKPIFVFVLVMCTIGSYQLFELPYALLRSSGSANGPANSALFIVSYLYDAAYNVGDLGLAAAVGWVLALVMLTLSLIQIRVVGASND